MTNEQYQLEQLTARIAMLEQRRTAESNKSFLGGGFGLFFFIFISMGFGILIWIITAISQSGRVSQLDREIYQLRSQLGAARISATAAIANESEVYAANNSYLEKLKQSFMHDIITADEYQAKKAAYEANNK